MTLLIIKISNLVDQIDPNHQDHLTEENFLRAQIEKGIEFPGCKLQVNAASYNLKMLHPNTRK
jgi:hypothetical protein